MRLDDGSPVPEGHEPDAADDDIDRAEWMESRAPSRSVLRQIGRGLVLGLVLYVLWLSIQLFL